jgi:hypothetical protein
MKGWKLQKFFGDLVYDLRTRGLLPFVVLLLVAIVAAPLVIKSMGSSDSVPPPAAQSASSEPAPESQAAVIAYKPGVRNYRERLDDLESKNPFRQQYPSEEEGAGGDGSGGEPAGEGTGATGGTGSSVSFTRTRRVKRWYFYYETDLRSGETGQQLKVRRDVPNYTILPSEQAPVAVYIGVSRAGDGVQAVFSVSRDVTAVSGEGICYPDPDNCELLGLEAGQYADLLYAEDGKSYRIQVDRVRRVKSKNPPD